MGKMRAENAPECLFSCEYDEFLQPVTPVSGFRVGNVSKLLLRKSANFVT
jgi:hypothetical protein